MRLFARTAPAIDATCLDNNHVLDADVDTLDCVAILSQPKTFTTKQQRSLIPAPHEVLVRLQGCGICASSLPLWEGRPWFEYPLDAGEPGHEGWGIIIAKGSEVHSLKLGQRVACLGQHAFAQTACFAAENVVPLPHELDDKPFPGEALGCAMNIFRRGDILAGQHVAIIGAGFLGLLLTQLAVDAGAQVYVFSRRASARERALAAGATAAFDTEDWWGNAQKFKALTGGAGSARVIEVTGLQFALDLATELVAEYGKLIIAGFHQDGLRQINMQRWNWQGIDVINAHERSEQRCVEGIKAAVQATLEKRIRPQELLTHSFCLDELDRGFETMLLRPDDFVKGWVQL